MSPVIFLIALIFLFYMAGPFFYRPNLTKARHKAKNILEKQNCSLLKFDYLSEKEKKMDRFNRGNRFKLEDLWSTLTYYKAVGKPNNENGEKYFWFELQLKFFPIPYKSKITSVEVEKPLEK